MELERLKVINKEVNRMRVRLKRDYFKQRFNDKIGDLRATWEVLGEALTGKKSKSRASNCGYFTKDGKAVTDGNMISEGFCDFYSQVGPKLVAKIPNERTKTYKNYMGERI